MEKMTYFFNMICNCLLCKLDIACIYVVSDQSARIHNYKRSLESQGTYNIFFNHP